MEGGISPPRLKRRRLNESVNPRTQRSDQSITVYSWNVNGIQPFLQSSITSFFKTAGGGPSPGEGDAAHKASLRDFLRRHHWPTLLFLQEIKISPENTAAISAIKRAVRPGSDEPTGSPDYIADFCLPSDDYNARGFGRKIYGVCCIIRRDFYECCVDVIRPVDWDREGRFLVIETKATENQPKLALINVYAVNGTENAYKDPSTGAVIGTRHDRKLAVHALLQAECQRLEAAGFGCIISGDLNVARSEADGKPRLRTVPDQHCVNRADFEARFFSRSKGDVPADQGDGLSPSTKTATRDKSAGLGMVDTFRYLYPDKKGYTYYPRNRAFGESCDRVDMIMISQSLAPHLKEAGMHESPAERGPSDHVPLFARLEFEK